MGSFKIEENLSQQAKQKNKKKTSRNKTLSITAAEVTIH